MDELRKLRLDVKDDRHASEDLEFLRNLSTLDFSVKQKEAYSKRHANTGQWLLDTKNFKDWLQSNEHSSSVLWCPGNPGAGKTVITSIAVNHVAERTQRSKVATVYLYFDYADSLTHSVEALMGSVLRQLTEQTSRTQTVSELKSFHLQNTRKRHLTADELFACICTISKDFDVVYLLVDALDECPEITRDKLLGRLQDSSTSNARLFLTSRPNVNVNLTIPHALRTDIAASIPDITAFLESEIYKSGRLSRFTAKDPELKQRIVSGIVDKADGMF